MYTGTEVFGDLNADKRQFYDSSSYIKFTIEAHNPSHNPPMMQTEIVSDESIPSQGETFGSDVPEALKLLGVQAGATVVYKQLARSEAFYAPDVATGLIRNPGVAEIIPKFPVLDYCLTNAKAHLSHGNFPEREAGTLHTVVLWSGMHKVFISQRDGVVSLPQDMSFSRNEVVARHFLGDQGQCDEEGSLFRLTFDDEDPLICNHIADLSWISKFPDEEECLVESGLHFQIDSITCESQSPLVEVICGHFTFPRQSVSEKPDLYPSCFEIAERDSYGISNKEKVAQCLNEHLDSVTFGKR
jgi:hypothetical protein